MLVDTHCHLTDPQFGGQWQEVVLRAREQGVELLVNVAENLANAHQVLEQLEGEEAIFAALGFHPHCAKEFSPEAEKELIDLLQHPRVAAVGETGLDLYHQFSTPEQQEEAFRRHLAMARELQKPLVLHCRSAYQQLIAILSNESQLPQGVIHCYSGTKEEAERLMEMGFHLGIGGTLTYPRNERLRELVGSMPLEWLLLETDAPYLAPQVVRGKLNEPAFVRYVAEEVARIRGIPLEEIARVTTENAQQLFKLPGG